MESKELLLDEIKAQLDNFFYNMKHISQHTKYPDDLLEAQAFLLYILWESKQPLKVSDLSYQLGLTNGAVSSMTDKLLAMKLVDRYRSEEDRRVVWITLTEKGLETIQTIQNARFNFIRNCFSTINEDELTQIVDVFSKINILINTTGRKRADDSSK